MCHKDIKVLLSKLGLDIHSRGIFTVAKILRDSGMEVIYLGNSTTSQIIQAALQEDVDVIGVSSLGGAHMQLGKDLIQEAQSQKILNSKVIVMGGVIPHKDAVKLKEIGFDEVFTSGATKESIVSTIVKLYKKKVKRDKK